MLCLFSVLCERAVCPGLLLMNVPCHRQHCATVLMLVLAVMMGCEWQVQRRCGAAALQPASRGDYGKGDQAPSAYMHAILICYMD